jgi:hypothetical protein
MTMTPGHSIVYQRLSRKIPVDERMVEPYRRQNIHPFSFDYGYHEELYVKDYDENDKSGARTGEGKRNGRKKDSAGAKGKHIVSGDSGKSSDSDSRYSEDSLLSHPSISSISTANGDIKYELKGISILQAT